MYQNNASKILSAVLAAPKELILTHFQRRKSNIQVGIRGMVSLVTNTGVRTRGTTRESSINTDLMSFKDEKIFLQWMTALVRLIKSIVLHVHAFQPVMIKVT